MVTAPNRLQNDAIQYDLSDFRVKHRFTVDHNAASHLVRSRRGKGSLELQMTRVTYGNNEANIYHNI